MFTDIEQFATGVWWGLAATVGIALILSVIAVTVMIVVSAIRTARAPQPDLTAEEWERRNWPPTPTRNRPGGFPE